jgi:hypothetical protein
LPFCSILLFQFFTYLQAFYIFYCTTAAEAGKRDYRLRRLLVLEIFLLHFSAIWAYTIHSFHRRRYAMRFCEQLNEYITRLDCRGKELAEAAGLSAPSLSRYRTGERAAAAPCSQR